MLSFTRSDDLSPLADRRRDRRVDEVRRTPRTAQAKALGVLARALEYLAHSTACSGRPAPEAIMEAMVLLGEKSRAVFAECPEYLTLSHRRAGFSREPLVVAGIDEAFALNRLHQSLGDAQWLPGEF